MFKIKYLVRINVWLPLQHFSSFTHFLAFAVIYFECNASTSIWWHLVDACFLVKIWWQPKGMKKLQRGLEILGGLNRSHCVQHDNAGQHHSSSLCLSLQEPTSCSVTLFNRVVVNMKSQHWTRLLQLTVVNSCNETGKRANEPSQQKPTTKAAVRSKPTNFTMQQTWNTKNWIQRSNNYHRECSITDKNRSRRREILVKSEINSISTLKRIDERNGWFNRHRENVNVLRWLLSSRFQDGGLVTYPQQNSQKYTITREQNQNRSCTQTKSTPEALTRCYVTSHW